MKIAPAVATIGIAALLVSGCATSPDKIAGQSVSTLPYEQYNCTQVGAELDRVSRRATELYGSLKKAADDDNTQMAVGMLLFWPALFFLEGGDGPEAAEYARLKGERDALERVAVLKQCGITFEKAEQTKAKEAESKPVEAASQS